VQKPVFAHDQQSGDGTMPDASLGRSSQVWYGVCKDAFRESPATSISRPGQRPHHGAQRMKQPAPDLHAVYHRVLQHLHPEQVEVERGRTEALEVRHGCSAERDERWSAVRSPSALVMAHQGSPHGPGMRLGVRTAAGASLFGAHSPVGAVWPHALLHRRLGSL